MQPVQCQKCFNLNPADAALCQRCGASLGASNARGFLPGQVYQDRYELLHRIGAGGMGEVWAATHLNLGSRVAIKFLHSNLMDHPTVRARALKEAKALGLVSQRNVISVMDCFETESTIGLVMEFVADGCLATHLVGKGALPPVEVIELMRGILRGLTAIHQSGLVHRDIKPDNILLARDDDEWVPKIADLGVAHNVEGTRLTGNDSRLGTTEYMAPEQIKSGATSEASDIYSCGVLMYELLTGTVPFSGSDYEIQHGHITKAPDMSRLPVGTPDWLVDVMAKAMAKTPEARHASARSFRSVLAPGGAPKASISVSPVDEADINETTIVEAVPSDAVRRNVYLTDPMGEKPAYAADAPRDGLSDQKFLVLVVGLVLFVWLIGVVTDVATPTDKAAVEPKADVSTNVAPAQKVKKSTPTYAPDDKKKAKRKPVEKARPAKRRPGKKPASVSPAAMPAARPKYAPKARPAKSHAPKARPAKRRPGKKPASVSPAAMPAMPASDWEAAIRAARPKHAPGDKKKAKRRAVEKARPAW